MWFLYPPPMKSCKYQSHEILFRRLLVSKHCAIGNHFSDTWKLNGLLLKLCNWSFWTFHSHRDVFVFFNGLSRWCQNNSYLHLHLCVWEWVITPQSPQFITSESANHAYATSIFVVTKIVWNRVHVNLVTGVIWSLISESLNVHSPAYLLHLLKWVCPLMASSNLQQFKYKWLMGSQINVLCGLGF